MVRRSMAVVTVLFLGVAVAGSASGAQDPDPRAGPDTLAPVEAASPEGVTVRVDPRIELMTVIQLIAGYPVLSSLDTPYRSDASAYFEPRAGHPAVAGFDSMVASGFSFDAVPKAFASMSALPELRLGDEVPPEALERAGGRERLAAFAASASRFARVSDFAAFFRAHEGTYRALVDSALPSVTAAVEQLEEYLGTDLPAARVTLAPLLHDGGFAMRGRAPDAQAFIGPVAVAGGFPDFGGRDRLGPLIWHEFAHTVVNPLTSRFRAAVDSIEVTDRDFRDQMRRQAYPDWETIVNESVIRAIEVRLATRVLGEEAGDGAKARQVKRGFRHVPALAQALRAYESDRKAYPTLARFYPKLLEIFRERSGGD